MTRRLFTSIGVWAILVAVVVLTPEFAVAQAPTTPAASAKGTRAAKTYTAPRTPDGQPDLQGYWSNTTYTPLERTNDVNKEFYSKDEVEEIIKHAAATEAEQTEPGT